MSQALMTPNQGVKRRNPAPAPQHVLHTLEYRTIVLADVTNDWSRLVKVDETLAGRK
jgi:hypothetical protein